MRPGLVEVLEASYRVDRDDESWMKSIGEVVNAHFGHGLGVFAIRYQVGTDNQFQPQTMVPIELAKGAIEALTAAMSTLRPEYVGRTFTPPCAIASNEGTEEMKKQTEGFFRDYFEPYGWKDSFIINGLDPTNRGLQFGVWLPRKMQMTSLLRTRWSRVAAHLAKDDLARMVVSRPVTFKARPLEHSILESIPAAYPNVNIRFLVSSCRGCRSVHRLSHCCCPGSSDNRSDSRNS